MSGLSGQQVYGQNLVEEIVRQKNEILRLEHEKESLVNTLHEVLNMYPWNASVEEEARALLSEVER